MIPADLLYSDQHEWIKVLGDTATVGISDFAQNALGDITFVDLPKPGRLLKKSEEAVALESCKAAASVYSPASGKVVESNSALADDPGLINREPYTGGWMYKIALSDKADLAGLMDPKQYEEFCGKEQ